MRESGATVNDVAKIHFPYPSADDHCISFVSSDLQIPPNLNCAFSYFQSQRLIQDEIYSCDKIFITTDSQQWKPYCNSFELNEISMLN